MIITNNLLADNANRMYKLNTTNKTKSAKKLSSGYRINSAADDAAGLTISEKMRGGLTREPKMHRMEYHGFRQVRVR